MIRAVQRAARHSTLALPLYLPAVLIAAVSAVPVWLGATAFASLGPWLREVAEGEHLMVLLETFASLSVARQQERASPPEVGFMALGLLLGVLTAALGLVVHLVVHSLVVGGVLTSLAEGRAGSFWAGCGRWWWPMLRLTILGLPLSWLVTFLLAAPFALQAGPEGGLVAAVAAGSLVNGWLEVARASLVVGQSNGARQALGRSALRLRSVRVLAAAGGCWLVAAAIGSGLWLAQVAGQAALPAWPALVAQQALAVVGAGIVLVRLAFALELCAPSVAHAARSFPTRAEPE